MNNNLMTVWSGKTKHWDEIIDAFANAGIKRDVDKKTWTIKVDSDRYSEAYGILMELNSMLEAGW